MKKPLAILGSLVTIALADQPPPPDVTHTPGGCTMAWPGAAGKSYFMMASTDLQEWVYFPEMEYGIGSYSYSFTCSSDKMFVRLAVVDAPWVTSLQEAKDADFDGDGIPNIFELETAGSDPLDRDSAGGDTDADGLNDGWELYFFGNLNTADPNAVGGDGLTNREKSELGLNPGVNYSTPGASQNASYSYDLTGRVTQVTASMVGTVTIVMDEEGNITTAQ